MERAGDVASYEKAARGRFVAGRSWLHFCAHERLWGLVLFGRPDRADAIEMTRAFDVELLDGVAQHGCLVDARPLEGIDAGAFETLQQFAARNLERSARRVSRLALILPTGVSGAVVAGFYGVLGSPFAIERFGAREPALEWLDEPRVSAVGAEIDEALADARGTPPLLGGLRGFLRTCLCAPELGQAAGALGLSERTLPRRLAEAGTSFHREVQIARVEEAKRRLAESADPVTSIALELGFASSQHFSRQFRQVAGESPSEWRSRHRTEPPSDGSA